MYITPFFKKNKRNVQIYIDIFKQTFYNIVVGRGNELHALPNLNKRIRKKAKLFIKSEQRGNKAIYLYYTEQCNVRLLRVGTGTVKRCGSCTV